MHLVSGYLRLHPGRNWTKVHTHALTAEQTANLLLGKNKIGSSDFQPLRALVFIAFFAVTAENTLSWATMEKICDEMLGRATFL